MNRLLFTILFLFMLVSCTRNDITDQKRSEYLSKIFTKTDSLKDIKKYDEAELVFDSAFQNLSKPGVLDIWSKYYFKAQLNRKFLENSEKALHYTDSMLYLLEGKEEIFPKEYLLALSEKESAFISKRDFNSAFEVFYLSKEFTNENLDSCDLGSLYLKHGIVNYLQEKYGESINYLRAGINQTNTCKPRNNFYEDIIEKQSIYNTIALAYEKTNKPDSAIYFYNEALNFLNSTEKTYPTKKGDYERSRAIIHGNIGGTYAKIGQNQKAEEFLKESIRVNGPKGYNDMDALTAMIKLSTLYIAEGRLAEVDGMIKDFSGILKEASDVIWMRWYKLMWDLYDKKADIRQAYNYSTKYILLKDSLDKKLLELRQVDFNIQTKNLEQKLALENLNKKDQKKNILLITGLVIVIVLVILLLIYLINGKRMKTLIDKLKDLNSRIIEKNIELGISLKSLEESQQENNKMMKIVAHDLRNPIGNIKVLSELIIDDHKIDENVRDLAGMIKTSSQNSLELIKDLLLTNQVELRKEDVNLGNMLSYCINMLIATAEAKNQNLILHNTEQIYAQISREKMWRVFANLISNAIKFSPENTDIHIFLGMIEDRARITVKDNGIGIPEDLKVAIFDMFTSAKRIGTAGEQTFGLGLAISKQIVEAHNGNIWFESIENEGTTFYVEFPLN